MIKIEKLFLKKRIPEISEFDLCVANGESYVLLSSDDNAFNHLINIFSRIEKNFKGRVEIDSENILEPHSKGEINPDNLVFLSNGNQWPPDLKVKDWIDFFKKYSGAAEEEFEEIYIKLNIDRISSCKIGELPEIEWRRILFSLVQLNGFGNYIFKDFAKGMPFDFNLEFKKTIQRLKKNGCAVLYFSNDVFLAPEIGDRVGFMKKGKLLLELTSTAMKKISIKEIYFQFLAE